MVFFFFFASRRRHTRCSRDWSSDVCSADLSGTCTTTPVSRVAGLVPRRTEERRVEQDRKSVVKGKSVDFGGRRIIKKEKTKKEEGSRKKQQKIEQNVRKQKLEDYS